MKTRIGKEALPLKPITGIASGTRLIISLAIFIPISRKILPFCRLMIGKVSLKKK